MADVLSAAKWLKKLVEKEAQYLAKVSDNIHELRDELEWMHCFLKDADASQLNNAIARKWVAQIREFSYEAEDVVEKFVINSRGGGGPMVFRTLTNKLSMFMNLITMHKVGDKIDALREKMSFLIKKLKTFKIELSFKENTSWISMANREIYFNPEKEFLVNIREYDLNILLHDLVHVEVNIEGSPQPSGSATRGARVFAICGEGGIGKTFLAKEVFHHPEIRKSYDLFAWASISRPCQISAVEQQLLSSLISKSREQIAQMSDVELKDELHKVQRRKRCLIVLDGLWDEPLWDQLQDAFPIKCHDFRSTILLTTRLQNVAKYVDHDAVIRPLDVLDPEKSELLLNAKWKSKEDLHELPNKEVRENLKKQMLDLCGGLPLVIAALGGVLSTKFTADDWEKLDKNFSSYTINKKDKSGKIILELSYYELPYQLKPCFLYMGNFPTNLEITSTKLCRLWEAEGLVSSVDEEESEEALADVAESCLAELVERSLMQVGSRDLAGRAKTCRLHDVMRDLCMEKADKLGWLRVVTLGEQKNQSSGRSSKFFKPSKSANQRKSRRFAIYCTEKLDKLPIDDERKSSVRSLLFFNTLGRDNFIIPSEKTAFKNIFTRYKYLRVLDIENIILTSLPEQVGYLMLLRYLSLRGSWVSELPSSIRHLRFLKTLDLRVLSFVRLRIPDVLCQLESLVHLYLPSKPYILRKNAQVLRLNGLNNLETLSNFNSTCQAKDVHTLTNLREFSSCCYLSLSDGILSLFESTDSAIRHLEYISIMLDSSFLTENFTVLANCNAVRKLWVRGTISAPITSAMLPKEIVRLTFAGSEILEDPMPVLEKLLHLKQLSFQQGSFIGNRMTCSAGGFEKLCYLDLEGLGNLLELTVKEKAMPNLIVLEINRCHKLRTIPEGLKFVKSLQELHILYMPLSFFGDWTPAKSLKEWHEYRKVKDVPRVNIDKVLDIQQTNPKRSSALS